MRILEFLWGEPLGELVKVKSWRPRWGRGLEWPTLLVDTSGGRRISMTPCWDKAWFSRRFGVGGEAYLD